MQPKTKPTRALADTTDVQCVVSPVAIDATRPDPNELLWTLDQVARALQVPKATIENQSRLRNLKSIVIGKHKRWKPQDVRKFVESLTD